MLKVKKRTKEELLRKKANLDAEIKEITDEELRLLEEHKKKEQEYKSALTTFTYKAGYLNQNKDAITRLGTFISMCSRSNPQTTNYREVAKACRCEGLIDFLEGILEPKLEMPKKKNFDLE